MPELEYEVDVPNPGEGVNHSEAEWREGDDVIHIKRFADRYESFWYTDAKQEEFATEVLNYYKLQISDDHPEISCSYRAVTDDSETLIGEDLDDFAEQNDFTDFVYLEADFDDVNTYWKEETPLRDDFPDFPNIIHVSGPLTSVETLEYLFNQLAPDRMDESTRQDLVSDPVGYIGNPSVQEP